MMNQCTLQSKPAESQKDEPEPFVDELFEMDYSSCRELVEAKKFLMTVNDSGCSFSAFSNHLPGNFLNSLLNSMIQPWCIYR